jgi:hypothetical protein
MAGRVLVDDSYFVVCPGEAGWISSPRHRVDASSCIVLQQGLRDDESTHETMAEYGIHYTPFSLSREADKI